MIGVVFSTGMPASPWHTEQDRAFSSMFCANEDAGIRKGSTIKKRWAGTAIIGAPPPRRAL